MSRILKIKNFRNIGLEKEQKLILNYSLEKGEMGNVIYLIGTNNSGKSNILDALLIFCNNSLTARDKTNLFRYNKKEIVPEISLEINNNDNTIISSKVRLNNEKTYILNMAKEYKFTENQLNNVVEKVQKICINYNSFSEELEQVKNSKTLDLKVNNFILLLKKIEDRANHYYTYYGRNIFSQIMEIEGNESKLLFEYYNKNKNNSEQKLCNEYMNNKYKYPFDTNIIKYSSNNVSPSNFKTSYKNLKDSSFFTSLFKNLNIKLEDIEEAYKQFQVHTQKRFLTSFEEKINMELIKISDQFNDLYYSHKEPYLFTINLGEENIFFEMARGKDKDALPIEYQSDGFRWFFNFFFNFIWLSPS